MGWWHGYYAKEAASSGVGTWLCARLDSRVVGVAVALAIPSRPKIGVVYYVAISRDVEGRGVGKALVLSVEELLEARGCSVFMASTSSDNDRSRRLFKSLGYREVSLYELAEIDERAAELVVMGLCAFEDEVVLYKGMELRELLAVIHRSEGAFRHVWRVACFEPWRRLRRRLR